MHEIEIPLRERHRAETWSAIREAAGALAMEEGFAGATIDAISTRAGVSRRTFFNYFQSKEDAVLGTQPPTVPEEAIEAFAREGEDDLFARTVRLLSAVTLTTVRADTDLIRRRELAARFPELRARLAQHVSTSEQLVAALLEERGPDADDESNRVLLVLAGAVIRFVYARNSTISSAETAEAIDSAITTFRTIMKEAL